MSNKRLIGIFCLLLLCMLRVLHVPRPRWVYSTHEGEGGHVEIGERIAIFFINEWHQLRQLGRCNWYALTLIYIYGEINTMAHLYELTITLLGCGFYAHYDYGFEHSRIKKLADDAYEHILAEEGENTQNWEE